MHGNPPHRQNYEQPICFSPTFLFMKDDVIMSLHHLMAVTNGLTFYF